MDFSFHLGTFGTQLGHPNGHEISLGATNSWRPTAPIFGAQGVWFFCLLSQNTRICSLKKQYITNSFFFQGLFMSVFFLGGCNLKRQQYCSSWWWGKCRTQCDYLTTYCLVKQTRKPRNRKILTQQNLMFVRLPYRFLFCTHPDDEIFRFTKRKKSAEEQAISLTSIRHVWMSMHDFYWFFVEMFQTMDGYYLLDLSLTTNDNFY